MVYTLPRGLRAVYLFIYNKVLLYACSKEIRAAVIVTLYKIYICYLFNGRYFTFVQNGLDIKMKINVVDATMCTGKRCIIFIYNK